MDLLSSLSSKSFCSQRLNMEMAKINDIHNYPVPDIKKKINVPRLLPGGQRNIVFEVLELSHIWGK